MESAGQRRIPDPQDGSGLVTAESVHWPPRAEVEDSLSRCLGPFALALLERSAQPFIIVELAGTLLRANRAFCDLLGYEPEELIGRTIVGLTSERWHETTIDARNRLLAEGRPLRYEKEYRARDGRLVPVDLVADVLYDEADRPMAFFSFITDLSEQKEAERALRESESRFRHLFDEAPFGYHEIDCDGRIVAINRAECEMLGYDCEELVGRPIFDLVDPSQRDLARQAVAEKVAGRRMLVPFERTYRRRDGRALIVMIRERLRIDADGRVLGIRTTVQDITEQKQMEAALVASRQRAQVLFDGIEDAVFVHDTEGKILEANPAASRLLGYSRDELLRLTTFDIDAEGFAEGFSERLSQQLRDGHMRFEGTHRAKGGQKIPVEITSSTIQLGAQTAVLVVVRDISERKTLEETRRRFAEVQASNAEVLSQKNRMLLESEARYRQLTEATLDAVIVADCEGKITLFNPAAERTFGFEAFEVIGRPLSLVLLTPEDGSEPGDRSDCTECAAPSERLVGRTVELQGRRKGGQLFPLELSLNAFGQGKELQYIGSIRDLTERQRMRDMLIQSEKLASIGLLSAGVAHEINNPLAYVANNLAVLERDLRGVFSLIETYEEARPKMADEAVRQIEEVEAELDWDYVRANTDRLITRTREGVQRVASIVSNLRSMARTAPPSKELVPLSELVASALEMAQGRLRKAKITVEVDAPPDLARVPCVANQIAQVILNLLINASQSIQDLDRPEGGRIAIRLRDEDEAQVIEIEDNGGGIEPEHLPRLFDPFFTTKPVGEGTGLGLAISHSIITGHGGTIEAEGTPGAGATFRLRLPTTS
ncbi:PAS domain-containing sensor histidine kinase [Tautonia rosea]|uniref:PAS domain-containing sensor histidine kinase n=1 Tax=Tautonia rosea TaxID=2728037 RepID=UPI001474CC70|nr:PAS domain S-box protein [Tautonia rosea]